MELPPVSVPPGAQAPLPPVVTATVRSVLGPRSYELQVQGLLLKLEADLFLSVGDRIPLRVTRQTPREVVFELLRPPPDSGEEAQPLPRFPPEAEELVRDFVRMRAPLDPALIDRVLKIARDGPTRQAAAFLAAHGFEPTAEKVESLARLALPAPPPGLDPALPVPAPAEAFEKAVEQAQASRTPLEDSVARILEGSPRLRMIDRLIQALSAMEAAEAPPGNLARALELLRAVTPETVEDVLRTLPPLPREALPQALQELARLERRELAATADLTPFRDSPDLLRASDRASDLRLVNQLARLRDDGVLAVEILLRAGDRAGVIPLRIRRESASKGRPGEGSRFAVTVDADLSRLGLVRAQLDAAGKTLRVRLRTRDRGVRDHLSRGATELAEALHAQGFEAAVAAEFVEALERESIFDAFAAPDGEITLDVTL